MGKRFFENESERWGMEMEMEYVEWSDGWEKE